MKFLTIKETKLAFTLAEVLITQGIIGVVAALTIPALIANYEKQATVSKLKESYAILQEAISQSVIENSDVSEWQITGTARTYESAKAYTDKYLIPYLKVVKTAEDLPDYSINYLNGTSLGWGKYYKLFLANGIILNVATYDDTGYVFFFMDTNGIKSPNKVGRDIFLVTIAATSKNKIYSPGNQISDRTLILDNSYEGNCNQSANGDRCVQLIMLDGWQLKNDYPW